MFSHIVSLLGATVATAATLAFATPASAQDQERATVSIAGLDLSNPADAARLDRRIHAAARLVCGPDQSLDLTIHRQTMACEKSARARATADVQIALRGATGPNVALNTN